ncbi:unnamed protein product [Leptidea sinapis]|uniref:Uncharacterized protein n=1 Tax=Leptidea sinapis TaxID=189913 RepID=A0A5E4PTQ9_9NEOP|nr:unnamed protein product [Leptidea sinapis]
MCLSLKQLEWVDIRRRIIGTRETGPDIPERKIQKFPSRERNFAVRRKNNNSIRSHINCEACARVADEQR